MKKKANKPKKRYISLMAAISACMLILTVGLCAIITDIAINRSNKALHSAATEAMSNFTNQAAVGLTQTLNSYYKELHILATEDLFTDIVGNKEAITNELKDFSVVMGNRDVYVTDKNGNGYSAKGKNISIGDSDYFKTAIKGDYAISDPTDNKDTGGLDLFIAAPIKKPTGEVTGLIVACRDGNELSSLISTVTYGKTGKAFMINGKGMTVAHSNKDNVTNHDNNIEKAKTDPAFQGLADIEKKMTERATGIGQYSYANETKLVSYHPVDGTDFSLALPVPINEVYASSSSLTKSINLYVIFFIIVSIVLSIFLAYMISKPYKEMIGVTERISNGDLSLGLNNKPKFREEALLIAAINHMVENLNNVLSNINSAADQVATGAKQVSVSSVTLAKEASESASSLEELTASVEEITSQTESNSHDAKEANRLVDDIRENANRCKSSMDTLLDAMTKISDSSKSITKIIKTIDDIAMQTNILALNAAVEAARAGVQGKGFAVIADEIRDLADRSAKAAKETESMIAGSIKNAEYGAGTTNETAEMLSSIAKKIETATTLIDSIATASNEQALGLSQVNQGIVQVSSVVESNSAVSEESAAASEELSGQAEMLKQQVNTFKLKGKAPDEVSPKPPHDKDAKPNKKSKHDPVLTGAGFGKY
ncbi:MAG: methyl-accepting chemotaxis protein [Bacillota bacterium]|nr:methyl-accepting chemotaxis protein [Bacillota bacterium]